jgi:hypothetical protein
MMYPEGPPSTSAQVGEAVLELAALMPLTIDNKLARAPHQ